MRRYVIIAIIVGFVLIVGVLFLPNSRSNNTTNTSNQNNSGNTNQGQETQTTGAEVVNIQDFAFSPSTLNVKTGSTVTWVNQNSAAHDIKIGDTTSPMMNTGEKYSQVFTSAGTYDYSCGIHPSMTGKIIVE